MSSINFRPLDPGLGEAVAKRTYFRDGENWGDLACRVALGNSLLHPTGEEDRLDLQKAIANGSILTAGRHLQHCDITQPSKNIELFSNCSTACTSFLSLLLLANGAGVGRNYSDDVLLVNWNNMPHLYCVLSKDHADYKSVENINGEDIKIIAREDADLYPNNPDLYYELEDSREGWAKALEILEVAAYQNKSHEHYVFDFTNTRKSGSPIKGMQNRPSSGPIPVLYAFMQIAKVKYMNIPIWKQTMFVDHYAAECIANGGARRSARIAIKYWKDDDICEFIIIKKENPWLWSSNNSIGVDVEFWNEAKVEGSLAECIFLLATKNAYVSGEPGFVNLDKLTTNE